MNAKPLVRTKPFDTVHARIVDRRQPERVLGVVLWVGLLVVLYACSRLA